MDDDERELRKRRRRSVRNLRRTSGILPLNLNALEERTDDGSTKAPQSEENQQDMFGSMWCESLEPVKKRRRRSNFLVGLVPKAPEPEIEEEVENYDRNNHNVYLTEIQEDQTVQNDVESVIERNNDGEGMDTLNGTVVAAQTNCMVLESRTDFIPEQKLDISEQVEGTDIVNIPENEEIRADNFQNDDNDLNYEIDKCEEENNIGRTSLNSSDLSNRSAHDCNLSKVSPSSMSPDFPISPSTSLYPEPQEESYIGVNSVDTEPVNNMEMAHSFENENDLSQSSSRESVKKSLGADQLSDLSHSDKENSLVNDNVSLNITPVVKDDSAEKVSPGFMSLCKAFAGKVVNFVKTSPSYLTGGILDSSHTANVCASPALKGNTSLNLASNELSKFGAQSDVNKSLEKLGAEINKETSCFTRTEIDTDVGDLVDNNYIESENIVNHFDKTVEKQFSTNKSMNQGVCGSAKKQRDRKTFFDTFNAVSDELKKVRRSVCIEDTKEMIVDKTNSCDFERVIVEHTDPPIEQTCEGTAESNPKVVIDHSAVLMKSSSLDIVIDGDIADGKIDTGDVTNKDISYICTDSNAQNENCVTASPLGIQRQTSESASKESLTEYEVTEKSVNINVQEEALEYVVDKNVLDNEFAGDASNVGMELDYSVTNSRTVSEDRCNKTGSKSECNNGTKVAVESRVDNTGEKLHHSICNTMQVSEDSPVKDIQKRRKRRALVIPNVDYNKTASSTENEKDQDIYYCEELCEKKQKLTSETDHDEELMENTPEKLIKTASHHPETSENIDLLDDQIYSNDKQIDEVSTLWKGKKDVHKTNKRKNRRKSFGVLSVSETTKGNSDAVKNSETDIYASVTGNPTTQVDEVGGINETDSVECHIEKRVAALDLGNENIQDIKDDTERHIGTDLLGFEHSDKSTVQIEIKEMTVENNLEKKKRGRPRRKSANLNDILKRGRGRPRKVICEQVADETNESVSNSDRNEANNISELTNEISQVQINDSGKQVNPVQTEISIENLVLPGDDLGTPEHKPETKRRRRRSAEAATLRLQMINEEKSPSTTDTVKVGQSKRGKRKSADAAAIKIQQMDLSEDCACSEGDSTPERDTTAVTKRGRKRKHKEDTVEELEKLYKNKNFVRPEEKKPWQTVLECPENSLEIFGKKRLQRHIEFERPSQLKLRRRLQKAVKNGWDPKKRKRSELDDNIVQVRLMNLWSELDEEEEGSNSLQSKLRDIVETT